MVVFVGLSVLLKTQAGLVEDRDTALLAVRVLPRGVPDHVGATHGDRGVRDIILT